MTATSETAGAAGLKLTAPRWTHVAIPINDMDTSIEFWTALTPLVLVARNKDDSGQSAWLSNPHNVAEPFVLVLVQLQPEVAQRFDIVPGRPHRTVGPFAHFGVELPERGDVDAVADRAREMGCLQWEPMQMPEHIGYICAVTDPDGNTIEFSHNQKVYETIRRLWGSEAARPA